MQFDREKDEDGGLQVRAMCAGQQRNVWQMANNDWVHLVGMREPNPIPTSRRQSLRSFNRGPVEMRIMKRASITMNVSRNQ